MAKLVLLLLWLILGFAVAAWILSQFFLHVHRHTAGKRKPKGVAGEQVKNLTLEQIQEMVRSQETPKPDLMMVVKSLAKYHKFPPKENGKSHPAAKPYLEALHILAMHKNSDKSIMDLMLDKLEHVNPSYTREIDSIYQAGK